MSDDDRERRTDLVFGLLIANDPRALRYLRRFPSGTSADVLPNWRRIEVAGGVLASPCRPDDDHPEVMGCWAFYPFEYVQ
jgi:hypothetical protein